MTRAPFDTDGLRQWADINLPSVVGLGNDSYMIRKTDWQQMRADLLAAAAEIELLTAERTREKAA